MVGAPPRHPAPLEVPATSEPSRARRFALPDLDDERTDESIEAFLEGPRVRRARPNAEPGSDHPAVALARRAAARSGPSALRTMPGRLDWTAALDRERLRFGRYGRPVAVAVVQVRPDRVEPAFEPRMRSAAGWIARVLRDASRSTDLVARVSGDRYHVLLPETGETGVGAWADRIAAACRALVEASRLPVSVRIGVAAASSGRTLEQAVVAATRAIEAA
jgi:hypothetical protein